MRGIHKRDGTTILELFLLLPRKAAWQELELVDVDLRIVGFGGSLRGLLLYSLSPRLLLS